MQLVSFDLCPYAQRIAIILAEKRVAHERVDIDLADKPEWFRAISPLGKVPLLRVGDAVLFESAVITEYLEETQARPLHPADPLARARHRAWVEFGSAILAEIYAIETQKDPAIFDAKRDALRQKFARVEAALGEGPWFSGAEFSVVDATFATIFRYFDVFEGITDLGILDGLPKLAAWRAALAARPSVRGAVVVDYHDRLRDFLTRANGELLRRAA